MEATCNCARPGTEVTGESMYRVAQRAELGMESGALAAYLVADSAQRWLVDSLARTGPAATFFGAAQAVLGAAVSSLRTYGDSRSRKVALTELQNNLEVFQNVKNAGERLGLPSSGPFPAAEAIRRSYSQGTFPGLWLVEGVGHDLAARARDLNHPWEQLLTAPSTASQLPPESLLMMHAGIGLAFAEALVPRLTPFSRIEEWLALIAEYVRLCQVNSQAGYMAAAIESLGLYTRFWQHPVLDYVDLAISAQAPEWRGTFWHGAGRALYFFPSYMVPGFVSPWREANAARDELSRRSMRAGLAWAFTLVNMRQPWIAEEVLRAHHAELAADDSFSDGVAGCSVMRYDTTPHDQYLRAFAGYEPEDRAIRSTWNHLIGGPVREAVRRYHPVLKRCRKLDRVFSYQPIPALVEQLEPTCSIS